MAFTGLTPEVLLERSDSKNPATTCKGITKLGRPCRNPLKIDTTNAGRDNGVLAVTSVVDDSDDEEIEAAAFFCHKHKDQAEKLVAANASAQTPHRQDTRIYPLQGRNSIDTLVARLGVLDVNENVQELREKRRPKRRESGAGEKRPSRRRVNRPPTWDQVHGPLMEVPADLMKRRPEGGRPRQKKKPSFWESFCCGAADEDPVEVARQKRRADTGRPLRENNQEASALPSRPQPSSSATPVRRRRHSSQALEPVASPARKPLSNTAGGAVNKPTRELSETSVLLSYIPRTLGPQATSQLLAELSKPISPRDDEGYIYIFWLTPESAGPAPSSAASSLLVPPSRPEQGRRTSDVLRQYSVRRPQPPSSSGARRGSTAAQGSNGDKDTILLKIGRANNVHRRMHEWTRQCGYSLSLVRFYPYVSSTPSPSPLPSPNASPAQSRRQSTPNGGSGRTSRPSDAMRRESSGVRKVPHVHRVERLIHLELAEQRVVRQCEACGKEHREWFSVEATRDGVKAVDEVVKRWVGWAEKQGTRTE